MTKEKLPAYFHGCGAIRFVLLTFVSLFIACFGCRPSPSPSPPIRPCTDYKVCGVTYETMQQVLTEAEAQIQDNWVRLPFTRMNVSEENTTVITSGRTATFLCPFENTTDELIWTHQGIRIPFNRWYGIQDVAVDGVPFLYSFAVDDTRQHVKIYIREVPLSASGDVQCRKRYNEHGTLLVRAFTLKVRPSLADVFTRPLGNQSSAESRHVRKISTFSCDVNGRYPVEDFEKRIIWRFNRKIIWTHPEHPFQILTPFPKDCSRPSRDTDHPMYGISNILNFGVYVDFPTDAGPNVSRTIMVIVYYVALHSPGRVECWYQTDPYNDEWVINAAYLTSPS